MQFTLKISYIAIYCRLRFYCVDVNKVPHKLVARAGVTVSPKLWVVELFLISRSHMRSDSDFVMIRR